MLRGRAESGSLTPIDEVKEKDGVEMMVGGAVYDGWLLWWMLDRYHFSYCYNRLKYS